MLGPVVGQRWDSGVEAIWFRVSHVIVGVRWMYFSMRLWAAWTEERLMGGHVERSAMIVSK